MSKSSFQFVLSLIENKLIGESSSTKNYNLLPSQKLAIFLDYLRSNSFHRCVGSQKHNHVGQGTTTNVINQVAGVVSEMISEVYLK